MLTDSIANTLNTDDVCAVVVTYNIDESYRAAFASLLPQVGHVLLVNTSTDDGQAAHILAALAAENPSRVTVLESPENNLALAQNFGIHHALSHGYGWVLLMDHDSILRDGMVRAQLAAYHQLPERAHVGVIAPQLIDKRGYPNPRYLRAKHKVWFEMCGFEDGAALIPSVLCVSASGCLLPRSLLEKVTMDESLVIDYVDTDFCLRVIKQGYMVIVVRDAQLVHDIGERKAHAFAGRQFVTTNHSALRRYYQYRNRLIVWKRSFASTPAFMVFDLLRMGYEFLRIIGFEQDKLKKLRFMLHGLIDGLLGRGGAKDKVSLKRPH